MKYLVVIALVACQRKDAPPPPPQTPSPDAELVSRAEPPDAAPVPRPPVPGLPDPLPGVRKELPGAAWRAAIGDLDGDGKREIVLVDGAQMRVVDPSGREIASTPVTRGIQVLVAADIDSDKRAEVFAGWGVTREHKETKAAITMHRLAGGKLVEETVLAPETTRNDVAAIIPGANELLVAYFDSKYMVTSAIAKRGTPWAITKIASLRTATSYARGDVDGDGAIDLVVGRIYGDDRGVDGDAFVLEPDGTRKPIPTTRGLRSLAIVDGQILMGDGWHQNYGDNARGLLTLVRSVKGKFESQLIESTQGQYSIERIVPATIGGKRALVTLGSHYVRVFLKDGAQWRGQTIAGASRDIAAGDLDGEPGDELVILGDKTEVVKL